MGISEDYAVQMRGITKIFGKFYALDSVCLDIKKGTVHALLGENGAGKSTLMNVLYGLYQAECGEVYLSGKKVHINSTGAAIENGIGMVHQHFMLVENFTILQNLILGYERTKCGGFLDIKQAKKDADSIIAKYGLKVDLDAKIEDVSVGTQQKVEILKALYRGAEILILDEPTAVLTPQEIEELTIIARNLVADGKTIIIITHKLKEILSMADYCTIIRRGKYIDTVTVKDTNISILAEKMVGRSVKLVVDKTKAKPQNMVFEIKNLKVKDQRGIEKVKGLNLTVRKGEILGIAGIDGNGQKELVEAITNLSHVEEGKIIINGQEIQNQKPINTINNKISTIHEDRHKRGLVLDYTVSENLILEKYRSYPFSKSGILNFKEIKKFAKDSIEDYDIRPSDCANSLTRNLSGGNQQKVIIAREVANNPDLLLAVQPTRGLDVGAIEYVHKALIRERDNGKAIILISYELDEVMDVSDTIAVIYDGKIVGSFEQGTVTEKELGLLMAGGGAEK